MKHDEVLAEFNACTSWEARARLLMQYGQTLTPLREDERTEANQVKGCESGVWLVCENQHGTWQFRATSDARLIRGLLALLLIRIEGLNSAEIAVLNVNDWFTQLGLGKQLSPSRSNGLNAVLEAIRARIA